MPTSRIPSLDFGGDGPNLLFLHANGYPPSCYRPLLERLAKSNHIKAMLQRPLWEDSHPEDLRDWTLLSDDLLRFLEEKESFAPVTIIGHSMGGIAALRAALRKPQKFQRLILLDPVLLPPSFIALWNIALAFNFAHRLHPHILAAKNRRNEFDDLDPLFERYRKVPTFKYMDDDALRIYIKGITRSKENGGYQLIYSPEWESHIYYASIWRDMELWRALPMLKVPTLIIRGAETDTFWERTARKVTRLNPSIRVETIEKATHLVALEHPQEVFESIQKFLLDES
jgi:pimeloyl-ACP methyl ester carboxylesterase